MRHGRRISSLILASFLALLLLGGEHSHAGGWESQEVVVLSRHVLQSLDHTSPEVLGEVYTKYFSNSFKQKITLSQFVSETQRIKASFGGSAKYREAIAVESTSLLPQSGTRGDFLHVSFIAISPNGRIREDIFLAKNNFGAYEVVGLYFNPVNSYLY